MIYHFIMLSGENEDFVREILVDGNHTFLQLHEAIQDELNYDKSQLASFFTADSDWDKEEEITLMDMKLTDEEKHTMDSSRIQDFITTKKDKLIYTFDFFGNRGFFMEVLNVGEERKLAEPNIIKSEGEAPEQMMLDDVNIAEMPDLLEEFGSGEDDFDEPETLSYDDLNEEDYSELF